MITAEEKLRWILEILSVPNQLLSLAEKATLIMARFEIDATRHEPDRGNRTTLHMPNLAKRSGLSHDAIGKSLKNLAEKHIIEREMYYPIVDGYMSISTRRIAVALPEELIRHPIKMLAGIDLPERNHGGKRIAGFVCRYCKAIGTHMKTGFGCICQNAQCEEVGVIQFYTSDSVYLLTQEQLERMEE